jgi:hypothetical protein
VLRPKALDYTLATAHELRLAFAGGARQGQSARCR